MRSERRNCHGPMSSANALVAIWISSARGEGNAFAFTFAGTNAKPVKVRNNAYAPTTADRTVIVAQGQIVFACIAATTKSPNSHELRYMMTHFFV
jgi:hypothetical protein